MTTPKFEEGGAAPGQHPIPGDEQGRTEANLGGTPDRVGPGTGDASDTRPLGDPDAPQGSKPGDAHGGSMPAWQRPAPAGPVRTSWADQGNTDS